MVSFAGELKDAPQRMWVPGQGILVFHDLAGRMPTVLYQPVNGSMGCLCALLQPGVNGDTIEHLDANK